MRPSGSGRGILTGESCQDMRVRNCCKDEERDLQEEEPGFLNNAWKIERSGGSGSKRCIRLPRGDADSCWDDVSPEIGDKLYVPVHKVVFRNERFKVGAWNNSHLPARAIEVGSDCVLVAYFRIRHV